MRGAVASSLCLALLAGCSCDDEGELAVEADDEGRGGYVRCFAAEAPEARDWQVGGARLSLDDARRLRIEVEGTPTVVAFAGPVDSADPLREVDPDVVIAVGDVAPEALGRLAALDAVTLVIPGGADRHAPLAEAFEALEGDAADRVLNAAVLRSIRLGDVELLPVAGAPDGRYAIDSGACGLSEDDLEAWDLGEAAEGVHRVLVSWAGPAGEGAASVTRGLENVEAGSPLIRSLAERVGAEAAVFAWPRTHAGRGEAEGTWHARVALRPLSGPAVLRADGSRAGPGPTVLRMGGGGLSTSP